MVQRCMHRDRLCHCGLAGRVNHESNVARVVGLQCVNTARCVTFDAAGPPHMNKLNVVVSLITEENDYQLEQAASAESAAAKLGANVQIVYCRQRCRAADAADPELHSGSGQSARMQSWPNL